MQVAEVHGFLKHLSGLRWGLRWGTPRRGRARTCLAEVGPSNSERWSNRVMDQVSRLLYPLPKPKPKAHKSQLPASSLSKDDGSHCPEFCRVSSVLLDSVAVGDGWL